ncbi:MAG: methyltransferase domain-containing protein [Promethearchaeota archaeon]
MKCRFCKNELSIEFIDLINAPLSNSILTEKELNEPEFFFPLKLFLCEKCFLVQIDEYQKSNEIFNEKYAYFSSFSKTWLEHSKKYVNLMTRKFQIDQDSFVVEIASNDGYLLQYFKELEIPCLGIEPASNTAAVAKRKGIDVIEDFFGVRLAKELSLTKKKPKLLLGNNVLAHVPDINDFVEGLKIYLSKTGIITMEFPHLMQLIEKNQFDTIYHEHFSYLSLLTTKSVFEAHNLEIFDVEQIPTHGGSLRIYAKHKEDDSKEISNNVKELIDLEISKKMNSIDYYKDFQKKADRIKYEFVKFLIQQKTDGKKVIAYGAAAKGNTLLNYCGIKRDLINFIVDKSPYKQGKYLPGSHIPIINEKEIKKFKPDFIIILPWNIKDEIIEQLNYVKEWGCRFVITIPKLKIL